MIFLNSNQRRIQFSHSDTITLQVDFENSTIKLPKIGEIKAVLHKTFEWKLKTVTISKSCTESIIIGILMEDGKNFQLNKYILNL